MYYRLCRRTQIEIATAQFQGAKHLNSFNMAAFTVFGAIVTIIMATVPCD